MKQILLNFLMMLGVVSMITAQDFITPDTGTTYTLNDLVTASPATISVSGDVYTLVGNLTISSTDALLIDSEATLQIDADVLITVFGAFTVSANNFLFTATNQTAPYDGFRFEEFSMVNIQNATIEYGGGLRVLTEDFTINNCTIMNNVSGVATGGVIALSRGQAQITNNTISFNDTPAISSGANSAVSPYIFNNYIEGNNKVNSNRPQINIGTTMATQSLQIIQNTIIGDRSLDQVGGIAISNFTGGAINAIIDDNIIRDNRYGLTILGGNTFAYVRNNVIENNDTQGNPNLGGSGISLNSSSSDYEVIASGNSISGNLWGITVIGESSINLGDGSTNVGQNSFANNGNGGITYALYNNTANAITAMNNCWDTTNPSNTLASAEAVIVHQNDNASLGVVAFDPVNCDFLSVEEASLSQITLYPNPTQGKVTISNNTQFTSVTVFSITGKRLLSYPLQHGDTALSLDLQSGIYLLKFDGDNQQAVKKLVVR